MPVDSLTGCFRSGAARSDSRLPRQATLSINNVFGMLRAAETGLGLASLPDYLGVSSDRCNAYSTMWRGRVSPPTSSIPRN